MESYRDFLKLYCLNVNFNNGNEYSYEHKIFTIKEFPNKIKGLLIGITTEKMFWPILYTALTTIIAFLSLIFSEIKPIIDFGWMMTLGLITSFLITFTLLPSLINFIPIENNSLTKYGGSKITSFFVGNILKIIIKQFLQSQL